MTRLDRNARILAVSFAAMAGMVDAIGFLASGGFFLSFMSGNSTRFSVGVVEGAPYVGMVSLLLLSFVGGVVAGSLIGRKNMLSPSRRQAYILIIISILLFAAPVIASFEFLLFGLCLAAFCMGLENTLFEREGSVFSGLIACGCLPAMLGSLRLCCWHRAIASCPSAPRLSPKASAPETKRRLRAICAAMAEYGCACLHGGLSSTPDNRSRQHR